MTASPSIQDIQTYLFANKWRRQPQTWNGASIWSTANGHEVLVPAHDEFADTELRVSEILTTLAVLEGRSTDEITGDMSTPFDDIQLYRTFPDGMSDGFISLAAWLRELRSARDMISAAARAVVGGSVLSGRRGPQVPEDPDTDVPEPPCEPAHRGRDHCQSQPVAGGCVMAGHSDIYE
jgi:hypothetical protein